jgi:hypothetical protein
MPPGLARDRHFTGFPEFEQFYVAGFPRAHSGSISKSAASTNFATTARAKLYRGRLGFGKPLRAFCAIHGW